MPYTNILIPLDGSPDSVFACETAMNITCPDPAGRTVHLLHCVDPIPNLIGGASRDDLQEEQQNEADKIFAQAKAMLEPRGFVCRTYIREGSPGEAIVAAAKETNSEIIIMGTRGLGKLESLFLGSVSREVLRNAHIPVVLANKPHRSS
ncbi:UspA domain protein [uncultured delta proteobacterium]|uniref:UspA domain protein n=1 Tax=uncultured delta proteobacterium TaxID=34034 RepID=A0A212KF90_9DELT|nr:UspA domain protein [uncultured delta proteobacterium]